MNAKNKNEIMGCLSSSLLVLTWPLSLADKAVMAPNLDSFGRDRTAYQEHSRQRRIAEREARRYEAHSQRHTSKICRIHFCEMFLDYGSDCPCRQCFFFFNSPQTMKC